jgi:hypothetical protein
MVLAPVRRNELCSFVGRSRGLHHVQALGMENTNFLYRYPAGRVSMRLMLSHPACPPPITRAPDSGPPPRQCAFEWHHDDGGYFLFLVTDDCTVPAAAQGRDDVRTIHP